MKSRPPTSPLHVRLAEIPPGEGLRLDLDLAADWLRDALRGTEAGRGGTAVRADLQLDRGSERQVFVRGKLSGAAAVRCSRCASDTSTKVDASFQLVFVPAASAPAPGAEELGPDDLDVATYEGDELDLSESVREELLLALPYAPLCREDCKGLCPRCGADRNEGDCNCATGPADDRWAALRNLKL